MGTLSGDEADDDPHVVAVTSPELQRGCKPASETEAMTTTTTHTWTTDKAEAASDAD
jgi:hypothetical protein